eukprot:Em0001g3437a
MKKENASLHWTVALYLALFTICVTANKLYPMKTAVAAEDNMANSFDDIVSSSKSNVPVVDSNELFPEMVHEEGDDICQVAYRRCKANNNRKKPLLSTSPALVQNNPIAIVSGKANYRLSFDIVPTGIISGWASILHFTTVNNCYALPLNVRTTFTLECKGKDVKLTVGGKVYTATQPTYRYTGKFIVYAGDPWYDAAKAQINRLNYKILPTAAGVNAALENDGMNLAEKAPQAAFASLTKSLQCEWDFLQRVVPDCADAFTPLNKKIKKQFFPAMLGAGVTEAEEALFALPTSLAGLGIFDPTKTATLAYQTSRQGNKVLVEAVKVVVFDPAQHLEALRAARKHHDNIKEETYQSVLDSIFMQFISKRTRAIKKAISGKTSAWLSVLLIATCHSDLSPAQFRDGLAVHYMRDPADLPSKCDGCGASLTLQHALDCKVGGLVIQRHNEIRDCIGDIAAQVWTQVVLEPIVREAETQVGDSGLRLDLGVHGVWQPHAGRGAI